MTESPEPRFDAAAVVAEIKATVARRRAAGDYPQDLLDRLEAEFAPIDAEPPLEAQAPLETVRPLVSGRRLGGRGVVFAKRLIRRSVAWYVRPVTEDQTRFNFGVVRRIYDLEARVARLEAAQRGGADQRPGVPPSSSGPEEA
ncbi:MAG TPA: hypothetical protein VG266_07030 [Candidatus Dormibacteraeota bacterium]|jgi:O-antigen chain-terminating methyltransferase|nr:hypothetical protein [Candidatus Dormibacteraeota bacterium]